MEEDLPTPTPTPTPTKDVDKKLAVFGRRITFEEEERSLACTISSQEIIDIAVSSREGVNVEKVVNVDKVESLEKSVDISTEKMSKRPSEERQKSSEKNSSILTEEERVTTEKTSSRKGRQKSVDVKSSTIQTVDSASSISSTQLDQKTRRKKTSEKPKTRFDLRGRS